jgi:hypothetical protein
MSKITFRADDDLIEQLEGFDGSKSEVMREALRTYLDHKTAEREGRNGSVNNDVNADTGHHSADGQNHTRTSVARKVTVNIVLDDESGAVYANKQEATTASTSNESDTAVSAEISRKTSDNDQTPECNSCGKALTDGHAYCPNCGEKTTHRAFCECGDEIQSDWAFCPGCGRRTPTADVLETS